VRQRVARITGRLRALARLRFLASRDARLRQAGLGARLAGLSAALGPLADLVAPCALLMLPATLFLHRFLVPVMGASGRDAVDLAGLPAH
jgi:hypothetical protein